MYIVKRRPHFSTSRNGWMYLCIGKVKDYTFRKKAHWETKYLIKPVDTMEEAQTIIEECRKMWTIPTYDYEIEQFEHADMMVVKR